MGRMASWQIFRLSKLAKELQWRQFRHKISCQSHNLRKCHSRYQPSGATVVWCQSKTGKKGSALNLRFFFCAQFTVTDHVAPFTVSQSLGKEPGRVFRVASRSVNVNREEKKNSIISERIKRVKACRTA